MKTKLTSIALTCITLAGGNLYAAHQAEMKMADEPMEVVDPKKKKAGEECKANNECQSHHSCVKTGDKGVCTAPPRRQLPPGAVTYARPAVLMAGAMMEPPHDPKKKHAGEECKSNDDCQKHHSCKPVGDKSLCVAPPAPKLPPGVVTFAGPRMLLASEVAPPPEDPKKKKAGEECKSNDECQSHHSCKSAGEKSFCSAPPRPKYKPGVVT